MNNRKPDKQGWYPLDLSAIVYPTLQRRDFSSVFRLSVLLKEDIQPEVLQRQQEAVLHRQFYRCEARY